MTLYERVKEQGEWALGELSRTSLADEVNYNYYQGRVDAVAGILALLSKESEGK